MNYFKKEIAKLISANVQMHENVVYKNIEKPSNVDLGDYAFPCFTLSKQLKKSPLVIAKELESKLSKSEGIVNIVAVSGYLNFYINSDIYNKHVLDEIITTKDKYGSSNIGNNKTVLLEHTSINPNASPHVGRARNAFIGDFISNLLKFEGYNVNVHYFVNDIGKQIAMLLFGAKDLDNVGFKDLLEVYVDINKKVKEHPELEKEVFNLLHKLENGDIEVIEKFKQLVNICISGQSQIFNEIGIEYDFYDYESKYIWNKEVDTIIDSLEKTGKLFEDDLGRLVVNLEEYDLSYLVVTRADKTSLYPLRDIAYTIYKSEVSSDRNILILGEDQKLYFKQIKKVVELLGYNAPEVVHYSFVLIEGQSMSTRSGTLVLLEDLMKEAVDKAYKKIKLKKNIETAKTIAYGAIKYAMLKNSNDRNVTFDTEKALNFEGDSASFIQYNYVRITSILNKSKLNYNYNHTLYKSKIELEIIKELSKFPETIASSINSMSPHTLAKYIYKLTKKFSAFYHECPVLKLESNDLANSRLILLESIKQVIENALSILGISVTENM